MAHVYAISIHTTWQSVEEIEIGAFVREHTPRNDLRLFGSLKQPRSLSTRRIQRAAGPCAY